MAQRNRRLAGHPELNERQLALMREIKAKEAELGALVEKMRADFSADRPDPRWVSIGATNLQQGFMALERAIENTGVF